MNSNVKLTLILREQGHPGCDGCTFSASIKHLHMKWEAVTSTIGQSVFTLFNNGKKLVTLAFNPSSNTARIECDDEKRVFLIRKEGILKSRTVLANEYGVRIGHTGSVGTDHFIEVNNERFFYSVPDRHNAITIFKESVDQPLAVCELTLPAEDVTGANATGASASRKDRNERTYYSLLMTLCWFLFQPAGRKAMPSL